MNQQRLAKTGEEYLSPTEYVRTNDWPMRPLRGWTGT